MSSLCQLAGEWGAVNTVPRHGTLAEPKIDGWRCLFFPDWQGKPALWTRNGIPIEGAGHILRQLCRIEDVLGGRWFIDGEWQVDGTLAATKAHAEAGWRTRGDAGLFHAFDAVPLPDWRADACALPAYRRKELLRQAIDATAPDPDAWEWEAGSRGRDHGKPCVVLMPEQWCADAGELAAFARRTWLEGGEGIMAKDAESLYRRGRSKDWLKIKNPAQIAGLA